jgi:hypothetical protein
MPHKDPEKRKAYRKAYSKKWWIEKKKDPLYLELRKKRLAADWKRRLSDPLVLEERRRKMRELMNPKYFNDPAYAENKKEIAKKANRELREQILAHYGRKCAKCSQSIPEFLTIHHMNSDGAAHRKVIGSGGMNRWIVKNDFPSGYQLLCYNCNCSEGNNFLRNISKIKGVKLKCSPKQLEIAKRCMAKKRSSIMSHYGAKCSCCGETNMSYLTVDHINNDGAEHRKQVTSARMYKWIIDNGFPVNFQILCYNCNCAKGFYGSCPHKRELSKEA